MSLARLTNKARSKFSDMRDTVEEAQTRVLALQRRISETEKQIRNLNHETSAAAVAEYTAEIERLRPRLSDEQHAHIALSRVLTAVQTWLTGLPPSVELRDTQNKFYVLDDKDLISAADRCHAEIVKLNQARIAIARALLPQEMLHAQIDAHVDALAARGRPALTVDRDQLTVRHITDGFGTSNSAAIPYLAWLHPEAMKERLRADLADKRASDAERHLMVLSVSERKVKLAEMDAKIMALSREEEFYICEAAAEGTVIKRRDNALPEAVLGVEVVKIDAATRAQRRRDDERHATETGRPVEA